MVSPKFGLSKPAYFLNAETVFKLAHYSAQLRRHEEDWTRFGKRQLVQAITGSELSYLAASTISDYSAHPLCILGNPKTFPLSISTARGLLVRLEVGNVTI